MANGTQRFAHAEGQCRTRAPGVGQSCIRTTSARQLQGATAAKSRNAPKGAAFEDVATKLLGVAKNNSIRIPAPSGAAAYRVPDGLTDTILYEFKNVQYQSLTTQIEDDLAYVASKPGMTMTMVVNSATTFSKPLQQMIANGLIKIVRISVP